jgi:hypothetical protein
VRLRAAVAVLAALIVAAAAAGAGGFPRAAFTATLAGKSPAFLNGAWRITFLAGGGYTIEHPLNEVVVRGRLATSGGTATFGSERGALACPGRGRYRWTYANGRLRLSAIADSCGGRTTVLASKPLRLVAG